MILSKNNQKGSTMLETMGVLAVLVMMGAAALSLISNIWGLFKQNMVVNEARDLQKAISDSYKAEGNYVKLFEGSSATVEENSAKNLCVEKIAPFQMCSGNASNGYTLRHRMSGDVFVSPGSENNDRYILTFTGLSKKACAALTQINWVTQKQSNISKMLINEDGTGTGVVVCQRNEVGCSETLSLYNFSMSDAMSSCNKNDGENVVGWIFF